MQRGSGWLVVAPLVLLGLMGCRFLDYEEREPWRAAAEEQCLAQRLVQPSDLVAPAAAVNGKGTCGMTRPFQVAAVSGGFVELKPRATLACPLLAGVEAWFHEAIQPAAFAWYGSPVVEIRQISAYSCRTMNGQKGASISEHAFGNALDIASFRFADGREVNFKDGWKGRPEEQGFLRAVHAAACERFSTVLAPGADMFHYDHIHVDLARRASGRSVCKPAPASRPLPAPRHLENVPVARAPAPPAAGGISTSPWAEPPRAAAPGPAGQPLVLGNQAAPAGAPPAQAPIAERARQSLGLPADLRGRPAPVPPGRIPNARTGADPTVTGSLAAEEGPAAEAASVFDLLRGMETR